MLLCSLSVSKKSPITRTSEEEQEKGGGVADSNGTLSAQEEHSRVLCRERNDEEEGDNVCRGNTTKIERGVLFSRHATGSTSFFSSLTKR